MKLAIKSFLLGLIMFLLHTLLQWGLMTNKSFGSYGVMGMLIFGFIYLIWGYWIICHIFILIRKKTLIKPVYISLVTVFMQYLVFRVPDVMDGHFTHDFRVVMFLAIMSTAFLLPIVESLLIKKNNA